MSRIRAIELPDGSVVMARLSSTDGYGDDRDVGVVDAVRGRLEQLDELIRAVGGNVLRAARAAAPDEAEISFGVELSAQPGKALAVLASGEAKASIQVSLTWRFDGDQASGASHPAVTPQPVPAPQPAPIPAPAAPQPPGSQGAPHA
ncbi:CU044_2847 family protein [Streptomyces sp. NPDC050560]|uniref:CU044_2847 family protein n=1 Tax=Streptomyces sp. NPDC050560 TaxID=3365630 RepID=UPI0037B6B57F